MPLVTVVATSNHDAAVETAMSWYQFDFSTEHLIGRDHETVARLNNGKPPSKTAWWSWLTDGREGIQLPSVWVGGRRLTSEKALVRWIQAVTAKSTGAPPPAGPPTAEPLLSTRRRAEIDSAVRQLQARRST